MAVLWMTPSPLYQRLSRRRRALVTFGSQVLGGGLGLAISLTAAWVALLPPFFQARPTAFPMEWLFRVLPGIIAVASTLALPIFLAYVAAFVTVTYAQSREYPTLLVTTLSNREIVESFVLAVLNRCGALLALQAGVAPFLAVIVIAEPNMRYVGLYSGALFRLELGALGALLQFVLALLISVLFLIGVNGLVASLAVMLSLWWRNVIAAASISAIAALTLAVGTLSYLGQLLGTHTYENGLAAYALTAMMFITLIWTTVRFAERWVRR